MSTNAPLAPSGKDRRRGSAVTNRIYKIMKLAIITAIVLATGSIIVAMWTVLQNPQTTGPVVLTLINANILIVLVFVLYIGRHLVLMFLERRGRLRRSRLPLRFLGMFSLAGCVTRHAGFCLRAVYVEPRAGKLVLQ